MDTNKAAYWIALGTLALGLGSEYRDGNLVKLHRVAAQADSVLCRIAVRAEETLAAATGPMGRRELTADSLMITADRAEMARSQAEMLGEQTRNKAELLRDTLQQRVQETVRERVRDQIRAQADGMRARAEMQRAQIEQIRWQTAPRVRFTRPADLPMVKVCPKTGARIVIDARSDSIGVHDIEFADLD